MNATFKKSAQDKASQANPDSQKSVLSVVDYQKKQEVGERLGNILTTTERGTFSK